MILINLTGANMDCKYLKENDGVIIDLIVLNELYKGNAKPENIAGAVNTYLQTEYGNRFEKLSNSLKERGDILSKIIGDVGVIVERLHGKDMALEVVKHLQKKQSELGFIVAEPSINLVTGNITIENKSSYADLDALELNNSNILDIFAKNETAVNAFKSKLTVSILTKCVVNLSDKTIASNNSELTEKIFKLRQDVFKELKQYAKNKG